MEQTMLATLSSAAQSRAGRQATGPRGPQLATLTYRSRAVAPMLTSDLDAMTQAAQARNRKEGLTGMMIYDDGRFFQWLEGPAAGLERVWQSVSQDPRHTNIEVLGQQAARTRLFGDWAMKLSARSAVALEVAANEVAVVTPTIIRSALLPIVSSVVIPTLYAKRATVQAALPLVDARAAELARLLIATNPDAADALIADMLATTGSFALACASQFEPTARSLGDLWMTDDCNEFEVTRALCQLQSSIRRLGGGADRQHTQGSPVVLVAPQPGEIHLLAAALDAEVMWGAGWDIHAEFPQTDAALQAMVSDTWFDALDLSLSASFRRENWLPRMTETIALARDASRNPKLIVTAGGRVFAEPNGALVQVGADVNGASALHGVPGILRLRGR
jgi:Sensors of blue-light using FAD